MIIFLLILNFNCDVLLVIFDIEIIYNEIKKNMEINFEIEILSAHPIGIWGTSFCPEKRQLLPLRGH